MRNVTQARSEAGGVGGLGADHTTLCFGAPHEEGGGSQDAGSSEEDFL